MCTNVHDYMYDIYFKCCLTIIYEPHFHICVCISVRASSVESTINVFI